MVCCFTDVLWWCVLLVCVACCFTVLWCVVSVMWCGVLLRCVACCFADVVCFTDVCCGVLFHGCVVYCFMDVCCFIDVVCCMVTGQQVSWNARCVSAVCILPSADHDLPCSATMFATAPT